MAKGKNRRKRLKKKQSNRPPNENPDKGAEKSEQLIQPPQNLEQRTDEHNRKPDLGDIVDDELDFFWIFVIRFFAHLAAVIVVGGVGYLIHSAFKDVFSEPIQKAIVRGDIALIIVLVVRLIWSTLKDHR